MSHASPPRKAVTIPSLLKRKADGQKISMVTCYDSAFGKLIEASPVDIILVGDSLGNVMLGFDSTIPVTIDHMVHHTAAVSRVVKSQLIIADMPFMTYATTVDALKNAARLLQEGGAAGVKLEGGASICPQVRTLVECGIPVVGHLGLTPQSVHALGGYKVQGSNEASASRIKSDALALEAAGACCVVLEMVPQSLAKEITRQLTIPTIGIGAGPDCDGQVLVLHDLLGFDSEFSPKFLKKYLNLGEAIAKALTEYDQDVKELKFPTLEHSFGG